MVLALECLCPDILVIGFCILACLPCALEVTGGPGQDQAKAGQHSLCSLAPEASGQDGGA
eukprot:11154912-Lingulodinium_polyedra.AAC.1